MLPEPSIPDWKNFSYTPYQKNRLISGSSKKAAPQEAGTAPADPTQSESYRIARLRSIPQDPPLSNTNARISPVKDMLPSRETKLQIPKSPPPLRKLHPPPQEPGQRAQSPRRLLSGNGEALSVSGTSLHGSRAGTPSSNSSISPIHHHSYAATLAVQSNIGYREPSTTADEFAFAAAERALHLDAPIVRKLPYRSGFQPNGVIDNKTDAFIAQRAMHRSAVELEEQRLERRLAKLVSLYSPEFEKEADAIALSPDAAPFLRRQGVQLFSLFQGKEEARKSQLLQKRTVAEQSIVKWQSDSKIPNCTICSTPFSLAVRRHHCRLCGRIVCSSPQLPHLLLVHSEELAIPRKPCSSLKLVNPDTYKIDNMPPHPSSTASPAERDKYAAAEFLAIRLCKDCTGLLHRIYYHQHSQETTQFTMYYRTLLRLQREITEALPDFHEMILGLQKKDTATTLASFLTDSKTLQENAMQARKDILLRLARYDQIAKATRNLPPMVDGEQSMAQQQLQLAVHARASLFLQKHMFPLQSLSNLGADRHGASAEQSNAPLPAHTDQLHVLMEQERLLHGYLSAAIKERNLDDVSTLKANRDEVRAEIARLQLQEKVQ